MGYCSIGGMYGVYNVCSIGGLYGVWLYWRAVWGIALLAGCMGYIMCALLVGCMGYNSIGGLYGA